MQTEVITPYAALAAFFSNRTADFLPFRHFAGQTIPDMHRKVKAAAGGLSPPGCAQGGFSRAFILQRLEKFILQRLDKQNL